MDDEVRASLRTGGREARRNLAGQVRIAAEQALQTHLASLVIPAGQTVGVTIADDGEPDLGTFVDAHRAAGGEVALPVLLDDPGDFSMRFRRWDPDDELAPGRFSIPCPPDGPGRLVVPSVVLVPLVRFDRHGNRLGRGAGFYDRWLAQHRPWTIGVAFEVQRARQLEAQPHDVPLDALVTDLGIRWFRPMDIA